MRQLSLAAVVLLGYSVSVSAACDDLFISEYIEGSSYNKAVELYNQGSEAVDLSAYTLELYSNGSSTPSAAVTLAGSVAAGDVTVISRSNAAAAILAQTDIESGSVINFNGDDAVVLRKGDVVIDAIGQIGFDPGSAWSANGVSTKDQTLVRMADVNCGDTDAYDAFDPSVQWESFAKDTFDYIGTHNGGGSTENNDTLALTLIHAIQGSGSASAMTGQDVTIEGIVTADYQEGGFKGFFVQEEAMHADNDPLTSEALFVYCPACSADITEGDLVRVSGKVTEYGGLTELSAASAEVLGFNQELPAAVALTLPVASEAVFEHVEGMRVTLNAGTQPLVVNENYQLGRYGSFTVASERMVQFTQLSDASAAGYAAHLQDVALKSLVVDDGSSYQNPYTIIYPSGDLSYENTLRSGYTIAQITGVLDQRYGSYRLEPVKATDMTFNAQSNPRTTVAPKDAASRNAMRVASFNVLNYFNTFTGCTYGVGGAAADCRGASDAEAFARQRAKIINAMMAIDADVFGLMEIENDGYDAYSAVADLVNGLNAAAGATLYAYVNVDEKTDTLNALGTDAIKVALVYNKKRVQAIGAPHAVILDTNDKNRPTLIQLFKKARSAKRVAVAVNHLKSKGSSCDALAYDGVSDIDKNDGQGNCNLTRLDAAKTLTAYIDTAKTLRNKNILLLGDFNSYATEDPVKAIEAAGYTNMGAALEGKKEYSYVFDGQSGTLDYAFANAQLAPKIKTVTTWHINTDEPKVLDYTFDYKTLEQQTTLYGEGPYRASDHDPVVVDIKF